MIDIPNWWLNIIASLVKTEKWHPYKWQVCCIGGHTYEHIQECVLASGVPIRRESGRGHRET
jgi:hypothetical protein